MEEDVAAFLGERLRRARLAVRLRQSDVSERAGVSQSTICRMELGVGGCVPLATWLAVASAVGVDLTVDLVAAAGRPSRPRGIAARCHQLVVDAALQGGWAAWTQVVATGPDADPTSSETTLRRAERREVALIHVWDVIADVEAAIGTFDRRLERERLERGPDWRVGGAVIIPATGANRRRLTETEVLVIAAFPERAAEWLISLRHPQPMPRRPGMIWTDERMDRLRPMLPYLDRRRRDRRRDRPARRPGARAG